MVSTRRAKLTDMMDLQGCNLQCLPQNYNFKYYLYHYLSWPSLLYLSECEGSGVVGYVLAKINQEQDEPEQCGHITSLSILRTHRRLGIASEVMNQTHTSMQSIFGAKFVSLHVRKSNTAALCLYRDRLGYKVRELAKQYYADTEDAYDMALHFNDK